MARNLTSLDLYVPPARCRRRAQAPVVVWVHGGGYRKGDKAQQVAAKVALFAKRGWIFASVNYRLTKLTGPGAGPLPRPLRRRGRGRGLAAHTT